jgi:hypothetical protein
MLERTFDTAEGTRFLLAEQDGARSSSLVSP